MDKPNEVAQLLRQDIALGVYPRGTRLPSRANLACHYEVSRDTMDRAVTLLVDEGLLICSTREGTYVTFIQRKV
jgi:GntR family transcriptional regulator